MKARFVVRRVVASIETASPDADTIVLEEMKGLRALLAEIEALLRDS